MFSRFCTGLGKKAGVSWGRLRGAMRAFRRSANGLREVASAGPASKGRGPKKAPPGVSPEMDGFYSRPSAHCPPEEDNKENRKAARPGGLFSLRDVGVVENVVLAVAVVAGAAGAVAELEVGIVRVRPAADLALVAVALGALFSLLGGGRLLELDGLG